MSVQDGEQRPTADEMRHRATVFVTWATAKNRLPFDFSVASLRMVDFVIDGLRKADSAGVQAPARTLLGLGAYVGEVLVRRAGATWVDFDTEQRAYFRQPVGVRMPDGRTWNPLGKVVNRYEVGPEESLQTFYLLLHGRRLPEDPGRRRPEY